MSPIMGAGGFIMAEMTGVPYSRIMQIAIFPALMYFFSVFMMVHYEAKKHNIVGDKSEQSAMYILKHEWVYIMPLIVITIFMLTGYSPGFSAILGLASCILVSFKKPENRIDLTLAVIMVLILAGSFVTKAVNTSQIRAILSGINLIVAGIVLTVIINIIRKKRDGNVNIREELGRFVEASRAGTESSLKIGATLGVIGIIIGVLTFSGLVLTFADIVIDLANGSLVMTLLLVALASLVLGMGVPVTARNNFV